MRINRSVRRALALLALPLVAVAAGCGGDNSGGGAGAAATTLATTGAAAAAPATTQPAVDLSNVTLRVGDQVKVVQAGLEAAGQSDTPYKIEWASFTSGPPLLEALNADAIDIGGVGDAPPIFAAASGAKIKSVLATKTAQVNQGILVKGDSSTITVAGLKGKKIAVAKGSSANWVLLKALHDNGLAVTDVEIAYLQPTDAQQAFATGAVDAWAIWAPFSTQAQSQGAKFVVTGEQLGIPGLTFQVASDKALSDAAKSAAIGDFLARVRASQAWQRTNKEAWAQKYSELTKLPIELASQMLKSDPVFTSIDPAVVTAQQAEADAFFAAGLIPSSVDFSAAIDDRFNDIAAPE